MDNWQKSGEGERENNSSSKKQGHSLQSCSGRALVLIHPRGWGKGSHKSTSLRPHAWALGNLPSFGGRSSSRTWSPSQLLEEAAPGSSAGSPPPAPNIWPYPWSRAVPHLTPSTRPEQPVCKTRYFSPNPYVYWQFVHKQAQLRLPAKTRTEAKKSEPK